MALTFVRVALLGAVLISVLGFSACNSESKEKRSGQALVSISGKEVTVLQLNDELRRSGVRADQYEAASKQLLESLIARQLIVDEALRIKLDRTPDVMQARERANAQVIAQAYLQSITSKVDKPTKSEIDEYFQQHPEYFSQRKQFDMTVVRVATKDISDELKVIVDAAKSIDEVTIWLDKHGVQYFRNLVSRSTADLPSEMAAVLREKGKNRVFIINEKENSLLISVNAIKDSPVSATTAAGQIEKYLINQKYKQATDAEIARLRSLAKIEYLNSRDLEETTSQSTADITKNWNLAEPPTERTIERGIMELR